MKHLLYGAAIAAALAIAAPAWAQAPSAPGAPPAPVTAPMTTQQEPMAKRPMAAKQMHHARPTGRMAMHHPMRPVPAASRDAGDRMTEQLNREELSRISGGGGGGGAAPAQTQPMPATPAPAPAGMR
jgi:hypothetical protein